MSAITTVPSVDIDTTEDTTPALVKALYSHKGIVPDVEVAALLESVKSSPFGSAGDALVSAADANVQTAREALVAARKATTEARATVGTARVTMARVALALTTDDVRGVKTMDGKSFAQAIGVSPAYVSQVVSVARAMRRLGTTSPAAYSDLFAARKVGAATLTAVVGKALTVATERTTDGAPEGKAVPVRATVAEISAAREANGGPTASPKSEAPRLASIRSTLDRINTAALTGVTGTEDDRKRVLAILATLTATVSAATLV